ncbi:sigma-70 family RNA polymerase sigma factor [Nannocystis bainbridge]|uniref:Sigma-70 family RNA polymerase sigma factor n=1 Tax=Nannocystis bainbridge TaxID=2995303 RepID=A0ABT5DSV0_9BACT|nr:sigma-70 family RNA polymerase sigma factor [Nannocystis bainbridge]MDC0716700.1 sigma-70 family RNA polymerase sigma factor [Nannocystis bainbridge]
MRDETILEHAPVRATEPDPAAEALRSRLYAEGRAAWPGLDLARADFVAHLDRHAGACELAALHAADFYLACACHRRLAGASAAIQARHGGELEAVLRSRNVPPAHRDDLRQALWEKLLVGRPDAPAKIGDYAGRGPLGGWLRVAAVRMALNFREQARTDRLVPAAELVEAHHPASPDPELSFLKSQYRREVEQALRDALAGLETDERNVLRLYFLDRLSIDRIAAVYGIHRATAARWVTRGREALLRGTQALLERQLKVERAEVDSILGLVRSQLELSMSGLFRARE